MYRSYYWKIFQTDPEKDSMQTKPKLQASYDIKDKKLIAPEIYEHLLKTADINTENRSDEKVLYDVLGYFDKYPQRIFCAETVPEMSAKSDVITFGLDKEFCLPAFRYKVFSGANSTGKKKLIRTINEEYRGIKVVVEEYNDDIAAL